MKLLSKLFGKIFGQGPLGGSLKFKDFRDTFVFRLKDKIVDPDEFKPHGFIVFTGDQGRR